MWKNHGKGLAKLLIITDFIRVRSKGATFMDNRISDTCEFEYSRDESIKRIIAQHPCYSKEAQHKFGRIHLAVAPECNMQCNYCDRHFDYELVSKLPLFFF